MGTTYNERNFLTTLSKLETDILDTHKSKGDLVQFSTYTKTSLISLINFVKSCSWDKSENSRFICKHFDEKLSDIAYLWNATHLKDKAKEKSENTFRVQRNAISKDLESLICSARELEQVFLGEDEQRISEIINRCQMVKDKFDLSESIMQEAVAIALDYSGLTSVDSYEINDCVEELKFLLRYTKDYFTINLQELNRDKLAYVMYILRKPLYKNGSLCKEKLELMTVANGITDLKSSVDTTLRIIGMSEEEKSSVEKVSKAEYDLLLEQLSTLKENNSLLNAQIQELKQNEQDYSKGIVDNQGILANKYNELIQRFQDIQTENKQLKEQMILMQKNKSDKSVDAEDDFIYTIDNLIATTKQILVDCIEEQIADLEQSVEDYIQSNKDISRTDLAKSKMQIFIKYLAKLMPVEYNSYIKTIIEKNDISADILAQLYVYFDDTDTIRESLLQYMDTKAATDIQKKQKNNNTSETVKTNKEDSITDKDKVKTKSDNKQSKNRRIENISKSETDEEDLDDLDSEDLDDLEDFDTDKEDTDNDLNDDEEVDTLNYTQKGITATNSSFDFNSYFG